LLRSHTVAAVKIRQSGATLITLGDNDTYLSEKADFMLKSGKSLSVLKQFLKAVGGQTEGLDEIAISDEVQKAADVYKNAKNAVIAYEESALSADAVKLIAEIASVSGHIDRPRNGIAALKQNANSQGLADLGILSTADGFAPETAKGLLIFGEDVPDIDLSGLEFLMVADQYMTETAEKADVVLPFADLMASEGTLTNTFGKTQRMQKAVNPASGKSNLEIIDELASLSAARYADGHAAGKEKINLPADDRLYAERTNAYGVHRKFADYLAEEGIMPR
jgi:formate dehydrogenase major subunit